MSLSEFDLLDKLVQAGRPLNSTQLGGNSLPQKEFRAKMCEAGLIKPMARKFVITSEGREYWQKSATPEQIEAANQTEAGRFQREQRDFLLLIRRKKGKLTTKDLRTVSEEVLVGSINEDLVRREGLVGEFEVLPKGEALLLGDLPLDKKLNVLRESHLNLVEKLRKSQKEIVQELESLESAATHTLQPEIVHLNEKVKGMEATFDALLHELSGLNHLLSAGRKFKKTILDQATELLRELRDTRDKASELAQKANQSLKDQQTKLESFDKQISAHLTAISRQLIEKWLVSSSPSPMPIETPIPTDSVVGQEVVKDSKQLSETKPHIDLIQVDSNLEKAEQRELVEQI